MQITIITLFKPHHSATQIILKPVKMDLRTFYFRGILPARSPYSTKYQLPFHRAQRSSTGKWHGAEDAWLTAFEFWLDPTFLRNKKYRRRDFKSESIQSLKNETLSVLNFKSTTQSSNGQPIKKIRRLKKQLLSRWINSRAEERMDYLFFSTEDCLETKIGINCWLIQKFPRL